jgi:ABC-type lipoprotein release transport system permease subunit
MFFTYLRRELRRRMRQAVFIALGLALGVGLVITVTAASAGVRSTRSEENVEAVLVSLRVPRRPAAARRSPWTRSASATAPARAW